MTDQLDYNKENMEDLAEQLRLGCQKTRTQMIEGYMALVHSKVNRWLQICPGLQYLEQDMVSEGYLAIVKAIDKISKGDRPDNSNVTAYVSVAIIHAIGDFLERNDTIRVPRSSDSNVPVIETIFENRAPLSNSEDTIEVREMIERACLTSEDRAIVNLLSLGYNEREIANELDMPRSTVNMLRAEIHERFTQLERC